MKRISYISAFFLLFILSFVFLPSLIAQQSPKTYVRFDRLKQNTATSGMVCHEPTLSQTESYIDVVFPSPFTLAPSGSWTVNSSDIPSDASAWPGIGSPLSVSGSTVRFPSSDLTVGSFYCFRWTSNTVTTANTKGPHNGTVKTYTSANSVIEDKFFSVNLSTNDQVTLTASVQPNMTDTELLLDTNVPTNTILREGDMVMVTLQYRSSLPYSTSFLLSSYWGLGKVESNQDNTIDVFEYVDNSALSAGLTTPTIDTINRSIEWSIPSLAPSSTLHTVSYSLRVKSNLISAKKLIAIISAQSRISTTYSPIREKEQTIQKLVTTTPSPTITPTPTTSATTEQPLPPSTNTPLSTFPTPIISQPLTIQSVSFPYISSTSVETQIKLSQPGMLTISYGTRIDSLSQSVISKQMLATHTITLDNLTPSTRYYLLITAQNAKQSVRSSIYTFVTADSTSRLLSLRDLQVSWYDIPLTTPNHDAIVASTEQPLGITVRINNAQSVKNLTVSLVNNDVLGINSLTPSAAEGEVQLIEVFTGVYTTKLLSPRTPGLYYLQLTRTQFDGLRLVQKYPLKVYLSHPLQVLDASNQTPIEHAVITLTKFEEATHVYQPVNLALALVRNTNQNGELPVVLPSGRYRVQVEAAGYFSKQQNFELGITDTSYPLIRLKKNPSLLATINRYGISVYLVGSFFGRVIRNYRESPSALFFSYLITSISVCFYTFLACLPMFSKLPNRLPAALKETIVFFCMIHALWLGMSNMLLVTSGSFAIYSLSLLILTLLLLIILTYLIYKTFTRN